MKNKKQRKICVVTGTRAEYGLLRPVMYEIKKTRGIKLQLLVTGMHLSSSFGNTLKYILQDGFDIDAKVSMAPRVDTAEMMAQSIGTGILGMTKAFKKLNPDIVLVLGDRTEALAAAIAAVYSGICVAHIHGGDSAEAGLDENARHAITKLAHLHFPATKKSAERIIKMGEQKSRIFVTGAPGLDDIERKDFTTMKKIYQKYNLDSKRPIILVVQHPVTTEVQKAPKQMKETLESIAKLKLQTIVLYPNSDAGARLMVKLIKAYCKKYHWIKSHKSLPRADYLGLLNVASVLVGNSSSGIIEAPSFSIPVIDIGNRQKGRENVKNILHVKHGRNEIERAIKFALGNKIFRNKLKKLKNPYSQKKTGEKIAKILGSIQPSEELLKKKISY